MTLSPHQIGELVEGGIPLLGGLVFLWFADLAHSTRLAKGKKSNRVALKLLGLGVTVFGAAKVAGAIWPTSPSDSYPSTSSSGHWSATFPSPQSKRDEKLQIQGFSTISHMVESSDENGQWSYSVMYFESPIALSPPIDSQWGVNALESTIGKAAEPRVFELDGHTGREIQVVKDGFFIRCRFVVADNRFYKIMVVGPVGRENDESASRFLDSFHLSAW